MTRRAAPRPSGDRGHRGTTTCGFLARACATACLLGASLVLAPMAASAQACQGDIESNDTPEEAPHLRGPTCVEGQLEATDQDLAVWEVTPGDAAIPWVVSVSGIPGTLTSLKVFAISSEAGSEPVVVERQPLLTVDATPDGPALASRAGLIFPVGRYLLGISRSGLPGGGEPVDPTYRYAIEPEPSLPHGDVEPNDDRGGGSPVDDAFGISGDLVGSPDTFAWDVTAAGRRWEVEVVGALGRMVRLEIAGPDGSLIDVAGGEGAAQAYDLALAPGTYSLTVSPRSDGPSPYRLTAKATTPEWDPEPNDDTASAVEVADGEVARGRLAGDGDRDRYALRVPAGDRRLRNVRVIWRSAAERTLCLIEGDDDVLCRRGSGGVALDALALEAGRHLFELRGPEDPLDAYILRVDPTSASLPDFELEPNDEVARATPVGSSVVMRGRGGDQDVDVFRLHTEGEPQLWEISISGSGIRRAALVAASGRALESAHVDAQRSAARLTDLYLVPGDHWLDLAADEGEYEVRATPLGPPSPDAEREPNSSEVRSERYRIGSRRTGRLPTGSDRDFYRFTLAAWQHIGLSIEPPADGSVGLHVSGGEESIGGLRNLPPGEPVAYDLWLPPGDYLLELTADQPSEGRYELRTERLDPFVSSVDQEPNDGAAWARPVPPTLAWQGDAGDGSDEDWFVLPPLTEGEPLELTIEGEAGNVRLLDGDARVDLDADGEGGYLAASPPQGVPLRLAVPARGPYTVRVRGGGLAASVPAADSPLELSWSWEQESVAAYWPQSQRLEGSLRLTNAGSADVEATLGLVTSHFLWQARPAEDVVPVPAGSSIEVPVTVSVRPDAWADEPVLVAVRVTSPGVAPVSATTTLSASTEATARSPHVDWPLPPQLLGGINAAWLGLGSAPAGTVDAAAEVELYDGVTPDRAGFVRQVPELPVELVIDLAGDMALPVAGTIINPQAGQARLSEVPREFELLLSPDGTTWQPALSGSLSPLPIEQAFTLSEPIEARQAKLRILSTYGDGSRVVAIGEWKVVLPPGVAASDAPLDLASAALGGHVVRFWPQASDDALPRTMLDEDLARESILVDDDRRFELVLGFHDGRAAQLERLEWSDPDGTRPEERLTRVDVSLSEAGPSGPWGAPLTWELSRGSDGRVSPLVLEDGTWARYVRLRGQAPEEARAIELPGTLRAIERPADADYRTSLGEWGYPSSAGPREWLAATSAAATDAGPATAPASDAADGPAEATPLAAGGVDERVEMGADEDWFRVTVPELDDTLELVVGGQPSVRVAIEVFDAEGRQRPAALARSPDGSVRYQAAVEPGQTYAVRVHQPPFSAVFTFDTSGSMAHFLDTVVEGIRSFAADVRPGREAVTIVPFEDAPLLPDWEDDAYLLQDAVNRYPFDSSSSGAEAALIAASDMLEERPGARAILVVTDAETSTYQQSADLWERLGRIRPIIFSVHVGGASQPLAARHLMQDWAASGGGHYAYPTSHGEMDRAFDRMAAWLRRPADYRLTYGTLDLGPGELAVRTTEAGTSTGLAPGVAVEIILDTSGSMRERIEGRPRIEVAREALMTLVGESLEEGVPVALRTFGGRGNRPRARCQTRLTRPLQPLDRQEMLRTIDGLRARQQTKTPIGAALAEVSADLAAATGPRFVVLVTDGAETCGGDPGAVIEELRAAGVDITVNIVGFALGDEALKAQMAGWAAAADGQYFDAEGADELATAVAAALRAPFRAYGPDGEVYEGGTVDGPPIAIDPGTYRVEVLTDPPLEIAEVVVGGGESVTLELPGEE